MIPSSKPVAIWLVTGVAMLLVQILLGGITRLTGSGLSITEWDIITGALPPISEQNWIEEFEKYKQTPQFLFLNFDFKLQGFKFIFFWEWLHRFWARLMGLVFIIPFIIFVLQKRFKTQMIKPLIILFLLGFLQGAIGWIMVASGLVGDAIYVKPIRLALHFIFAMGLLCYTFWFALQLIVHEKQKIQTALLYKFSIAIIAILAVQLIYGALMAGHKAATAAPTWPDINGELIPEKITQLSANFIDFMEDKIIIHFVHRILAYLLFVMIIIWTWKAFRIKMNSLFSKTRLLPIILILVQILLGVFSLLSSSQIVPNNWRVFEWTAQLHQLVAMFLLLSFVWMLFISSTKKARS